MQVTEIQTDHTLMALDLSSTPEYPIRFYLDIMDQFDRAGIHWHWHPELEFNVITRGTIEYAVENEHDTLSAGQGILKNANLLHMAQPAPETPDAEMFSIIMDPLFIAPPQSLLYRKYVAPLLGSRGLSVLKLDPAVGWQREIVAVLQRAYHLSQREKGSSELRIHRCMSRMWEILYEHQDDLPQHHLTTTQRINQVRLKQMIAYLQANFSQKLTLAEIAAAANVSSNTCLNCFRQVLGISPMEFLTTYRLEQARHLLLTTDWPAAQVGERCGFPDPSYFGKLFRQKMGKTPGQCRRGIHGESD